MYAQIDHPAWRAVAAYLEQRKYQIDEEIRAYPAPIPACDAQFNYLMNQRALLTRALGRLITASKQHRADADSRAWLDAVSDILEHDLRELIDRLVEQGLIEVSDEDSS